MKKEDKKLLLQDLCARLPYGVKASVYSYWNESYLDDSIVGVDIEEDEFFCSIVPGVRCPIIKTKPYLFPLSSMTEEQTEELIKLINTGQNDNNEFMRSLCRIEFYHKHHFDYRGLIPMGLAIDATGLNIY